MPSAELSETCEFENYVYGLLNVSPTTSITGAVRRPRAAKKPVQDTEPSYGFGRWHKHVNEKFPLDKTGADSG